MATKSLESTFIYRHMNSNNVISNSIMKALKEGQRVTKSNMEEAFIIMNKNFKYPLKHQVLNAVEDGKLVMMYSPQNVRIPPAMPFFLTKNSQGQVVAIVLVDIYGKMQKDSTNIAIDPKKLYSMLEGAYLALTYYHHSRELAQRNVIITNGSSIYANMFARVLNKKYALNVDKSKLQKVIFLASKFYLINILGMKDTEMTTNYAMRNVVSGNPYTLKEINELMDEESYQDIANFLQALSRPEMGLGMDDLTVRGYLEQFINMYDASALLALEYFPYFMYNVVSVVNGAYINNQYILEDIVEKHGPKLYTDMVALER